MRRERSRPMREYRAAPGHFTDSLSQPSDNLPLVTACVRVDLSGEHYDDWRDRRALFALEAVPDGARVVVNIGSRSWLWDSTAHLLHRHAQRLLIELEGTPEADIRRWLAAVRTGETGVIV